MATYEGEVMTDPVEALAAATLDVFTRGAPAPEGSPRRFWQDQVNREDATLILAALRASGFDVVPTGEPAGTYTVATGTGAFREPAGSADAARELLEWASPDTLNERIAAFEAAIRAESTGTLDGRAVHAAWRDGMLAQGREVAPERMAWETLTQQDRDLDDGIAARLRVPTGDAGLDVERLRHALVRADEAMGDRYPETFPLDLTNTGWPRFAEAIAAEYARLSDTGEPKGQPLTNEEWDRVRMDPDPISRLSDTGEREPAGHHDLAGWADGSDIGERG